MKPLFVSALRWALIGGIAIIILQTILLLINPMAVGGMWVILVYLPLLFCMIYGGISLRKENGGQMPFGKAFGAVFVIAFVGSVLFNIYLYQLWMKIIDPDFLQNVMRIAEKQAWEQQEKYNLTDAQVEKQLDMMRNLNFELVAYGISSVCSLLLSLVVAAFVSRSDKNALPIDNPEPQA